MANPSWSDALLLAHEAATRFERAWPSLDLRVVGEPGTPPGEFQPLYARIHIVASPASTSIRVPVSHPPVLQARAPSSALGALLQAWAHDQPYRLGEGATLRSPHHGPDASLAWHSILDTGVGRRLLQPLPPSVSRHSVYWLEGSGAQLDHTTTAAIQEGLTRRQLRLEDYLGSAWSPQMEWLEIAIPVPAAVDAIYSEDSGTVHVAFRCGPPLHPDQFWARISEGPWDETEPARHFADVSTVDNGWTSAALDVTIGPTPRFTVWVGTDDPHPEFEWVQTLQGIPSESVDEPELGSPLDLVEALGYLDAVWQLSLKTHLVGHPRPAAVARLALSCTSPDEFDARLSSLADVVGHLSVDLPPEEEQLAKDADERSLARLRRRLVPLVEPGSLARIDRALGTLRTAIRIRAAAQHSGAGGVAIASFQALGLAYPPDDWGAAWERIRSRCAVAVDAIREELQLIAP